ncbi:DsbA family protein [Bacillus cereus]|uniref:DsbA family protein n=1 Tax=Bacillus cereus TaxID=1396 RepID=UPI0024915B06|nr:DsbA family protein [Bacillus cereus]
MKIEVWSDFVCPFCYIGKRRLEMALEQFPYKKDVEVEFKSFELDQMLQSILEQVLMKYLHQSMELVLKKLSVITYS